MKSGGGIKTPVFQDIDAHEEKTSPRNQEAFAVKIPSLPDQPWMKFNQSATNNMQFGAYAPSADKPLDLSKDAWEKEKKEFKPEPWNSTPQGRFALRCFTRGVLGCLFYAAGNRAATAGMRGYRPDRAPLNPIQGIAKFFDVAAGKPIKAVVNALGGDGARAVAFRPTRVYYGPVNAGGQNGRSLGHEIVGVTLDFAAMSVGDAIGRDIVGVLDPNIEKSWMKDGKIDYSEAAKCLAMNSFRYITYNQGEDWAVALPYVYIVRAQRNLINKFSPGFKYDSDRGWNGGSFKVNDQSKVVGNYQLEGLLDLQTRFSIYNVGTLMFREAYTEIADRILSWREKGCNPFEEHTPDHSPPPNRTFLDSIAHNATAFVKWAARDTVKGFIYMTPSVPFFWISRTPQSKHSGLLIHPEKGALAYHTAGSPEIVHANEPYRSSNRHRPPAQQFTEHSPVYYAHFDRASGKWDMSQRAVNPFSYGPFNQYGQTFGPFDAALNQVGKANNAFRKSFHKPVRWLEAKTGLPWDKQLHAKRFMDNYAKAALAYTPYFWAKTEFANLWDNGRMDEAVERMLGGVAKLDYNEFKAGIGEIADTMQLKPLSDPAREAAAKKRIEEDVSPADIFDPKIGNLGHRGCNRGSYVEQLKKRKETAEQKFAEHKANSPRSFSEKVLSGRTPQKDVTKEEKSFPGFQESTTRFGGYAPQETIRNLSDERAPPGVTIH